MYSAWRPVVQSTCLLLLYIDSHLISKGTTAQSLSHMKINSKYLQTACLLSVVTIFLYINFNGMFYFQIDVKGQS